MKIQMNCMQCFQEQGKPSFEFQTVELNDDGVYECTCSQGHVTFTVIQEQKFEILFDSGVMALLDGYPREALSSFAASLERFYEFYIKVVCIKHEIKIDDFREAWKNVSVQSERQFGAYVFLFLLDHKGKEVPTIDNEKPDLEGKSKNRTQTWKEFRNAVIHKGFIPSQIETMAYGSLVFNHIHDLIKDLKKYSQDAVNKVTFHHVARINERAEGKVVSTMSIPSLISLTKADNSKTFEEALNEISKYRQWLYQK